MFKTLAEVKAANKANGNYWFERSTMRFFKSQGGNMARSEYDDCEPVPEQLAEYANRNDYTTADLQTDPQLRRRLAAELAKEAGIEHMTLEQQEAWWNGQELRTNTQPIT
jgi:hypothetical protein